jgi:hypothetical protein
VLSSGLSSVKMQLLEWCREGICACANECLPAYHRLSCYFGTRPRIRQAQCLRYIHSMYVCMYVGIADLCAICANTTMDGGTDAPRTCVRSEQICAPKQGRACISVFRNLTRLRKSLRNPKAHKCKDGTVHVLTRCLPAKNMHTPSTSSFSTQV